MAISRIRSVDFEATGFHDEGGRICEVGYQDLVFNGTAWELSGDPVSWLCDPVVAMPETASAVHHIVDDDLDGCPQFDPERLLDGFDFGETAVFAAHFAKAEIGYLNGALPDAMWLCTYKAALWLWPEAPEHKNQTLRYWRSPRGLDRAYADQSHRAGPDAYVTAFILRDLLLETTPEQIAEWTLKPALQPKCWIGAWRGRPWREVDYGFLEWVSGKDFDEDVLFTVRHEMDRRDQEAAEARKREANLCSDCPPVSEGDKARCAECPRRADVVAEVSGAELERRGQGRLV